MVTSPLWRRSLAAVVGAEQDLGDQTAAVGRRQHERERYSFGQRCLAAFLGLRLPLADTSRHGVGQPFAPEVPPAAAVRQPAAPSAPPLPSPLAGPGTQAGQRADSVTGPLRTAYALMLSTALSAVLGLGFWLLAAQSYSAANVGRGVAAVAALKILAALSAGGFIGALVRFIPHAGHAASGLIRRAYLISALLSTCIASLFVLTTSQWSTYGFLAGAAAGIGFVLAVLVWGILIIQDGILTGLRAAIWIPVGNTAFSAAKLLLLAVFATALPATGIYVSWAAATLVSVLPLGWLIFRRLIPKKTSGHHNALPPAREIRRFLVKDNLKWLPGTLTVTGLPVLVALCLGPQDNAYFYIPYVLSGTASVAVVAVASSVPHVTASARNTIIGIVFRQLATVVTPILITLFVGAPWILALFGSDYAQHGASLLRLLSCAMIPAVFMESYFAVLRAQGRSRRVGFLEVVHGLTVLVGAYTLLPIMGPSGAGVALLAGPILIVAVTLPDLVAVLRTRNTATEHRSEVRSEAPLLLPREWHIGSYGAREKTRL